MDDLGNVITILGILVTFVAYFGQHSGTTLADLEPGLMKGWRAARARARRLLGRPKSQTITLGMAAELSSVVGNITLMTWRPIQPHDDIAVRADKLASNLDSLRANVQHARDEDQQHAREAHVAATARIEALEQRVVQQQAEEKRETTAAMRWEVRGLLIALVGAALAVLG